MPTKPMQLCLLLTYLPGLGGHQGPACTVSLNTCLTDLFFGVLQKDIMMESEGEEAPKVAGKGKTLHHQHSASKD